MRTSRPPDPRLRRGHPVLRTAVLCAMLALPAAAAAQPLGVPPVPRPRVETKPPRPPTERLVWQPGTWDWDAASERYTWRAGRHVIRRPGTPRFVPGRWVQTAGEWTWRRARWR